MNYFIKQFCKEKKNTFDPPLFLQVAKLKF